MSFRLLSYLFLIAVVIQFFLAGYGIAELGGEDIEPHRAWGFAALHLIPILMFGAAIWAKMGKATIGMVFVLFVLVFIQPVFVDADTAWIAALHVVNALLIFMLGYHLTQRAGPLKMPMRT